MATINQSVGMRGIRRACLIGLLSVIFSSSNRKLWAAEPTPPEVRRFCRAAFDGYIAYVRHELKLRPELVHARDKEWGTAVSAAARGNQPEIMRELIDAGADFCSLDPDSRPPLRLAAMNNSLEAAELLLKEGANPNATICVPIADDDNPGAVRFVPSPLDDAAYKGNLKMVELLLSYGGDPRLGEGTKGNSLLYACRADIDPEIAVRQDNRSKRIIIKRFIDLGANINGVDRFGETPLIKAVKTLNVEIVRFLVNNCKGLQVDFSRDDGSTALHHAAGLISVRPNATRDRDAIIKLLLAAGADPDRRTKSGITPLSYAKDDSVRQILKNASALKKVSPVE